MYMYSELFSLTYSLSSLQTSSSSMASISSQLSQPSGSRDSIITLSDDECDCNIWDELEREGAKMRYDKKKQGVVVGASFNRLVEKITSVTDHGKRKRRVREREVSENI